jgi:hypothetical protein
MRVRGFEEVKIYKNFEKLSLLNRGRIQKFIKQFLFYIFRNTC